MRVLHTSDWHLGQTLHEYERSYEHQCFLDWLLNTLEQEAADVLLIAGDIFDNANPSAHAQKQLYQFLSRAKLQQPQLEIVIIAGNHDSASRLEAPSPLLDSLGIHVVGQVWRNQDAEIDLERFIIPLKDKTGQVAAHCIALPFLRPGDVPRPSAELSAELSAEDSAKDSSEVDAYMAGIRQLYQESMQLALQRQQAGQAIIAMGHCHMIGGLTSEHSERHIVIGGSEALPSNTFDARLAYVALGHLHRAQRVASQEHIRYCGSPLPMSFAELHYQHQIVRFDLREGQAHEITPILVPRAVALLRVPEKPAPLIEVLAAMLALDVPADTPLPQQAYVRAQVLMDGPEPGIRNQIEDALQGKAVRFAGIDPFYAKPTTSAEFKPGLSLDELAKMQPEDIFQHCYQEQYGQETPAELLSAFAELLHNLHTQEG